jgi:hypothetical protein
MIVLEIYIEDVSALKSEGDAVALGHRYCKVTFPITLQRMKTQSRKIHISKVSCAIENIQSNADAVDHFRWNTLWISCRKVPLQPSMLECLNHAS